ncbi:protein BatD [Flavobacteriaceae bacterium AU392]|nr:protein BatD [Flavobacteriaceae bacterium]RKM84710.1 protein BatD [Flavobacteriaceae bacterium AU392]
MKLKFYIIAFLLTSFASAQVTFEAKVSKKKLGVNERLRIDFIMDKDGDNFNPPTFENFTVVGGPSQSISNSWFNGKRSFSKTYTYILAPKKRGNFKITQATIEFEGETYKTLPLDIFVTAAVELPKDPNDPNYLASKNIHLVAEVSKSNPYLNEAITVVYKLYISPSTGVDKWDNIDIPRYNDFWSQDIEVKELKLENGTYQGEEYRYVVLRKTVLYPQKTGKLNIEPLTLNVFVSVPTSRRDIFGSRIRKTVQRTISAGNREINVKALPEEGKPLNYTGAVGDFSFKVTTNKSELKATEALLAKLEVTGKGNLKLFKLPGLKLPSSLEVYEPEHKENVRTNLGGMQGNISDAYTIVPSTQGKYPIPPVEFSYFDLKTKKYKTLTSKEIVVNVTEDLSGSIIASNEPNSSLPNKNKQQVTSTSNQFASFKTKTSFIAIQSSQFFKTNLFWTLLLTPFLVIPLAIFIGKKKEERDNDVVGNKMRKANKLTRKYLGEAKKSLGKKEAFYNAMERALHNYLKYKLNIETSDLSKDKIEDLLDKRKVSRDTITEFNSLLQSCELARYTPFTNVEMQQDYEKAANVIATIDKQMR